MFRPKSQGVYFRTAIPCAAGVWDEYKTTCLSGQSVCIESISSYVEALSRPLQNFAFSPLFT